jgi:hypothetical protein
MMPVATMDSPMFLQLLSIPNMSVSAPQTVPLFGLLLRKKLKSQFQSLIPKSIALRFLPML